MLTDLCSALFRLNDTALEDKPLEDKTLEDKTLEDNTLEDKTLEDKTLEEKAQIDLEPRVIESSSNLEYYMLTFF